MIELDKPIFQTYIMEENQIGYKLFQLLKELDIHDYNSWKIYKEEIASHSEKKAALGGILEMILDEYYKL